jgi:hypothetical protein
MAFLLKHHVNGKCSMIPGMSEDKVIGLQCSSVSCLTSIFLCVCAVLHQQSHQAALIDGAELQLHVLVVASIAVLCL